MTLFANLPFSRQIKSARQHILADLRKSINSFRLTKQDAPRIRIRSLDVIPLALSLPRSSSLSEITQAIVNCSSLDEWFQLQISSPFTNRLLDHLLAFFSRPQPHLTQRIPSLLTWNPSSLSTIHQQPSPKINLVLKRAQSHICLLQETNWSSVQYQHLLLSSPFCEILHSPATGEGSSGVATFLPRPLAASTHRIVAPGYILSVYTSIAGLSFEIINVYLHPKKIPHLGSLLLEHLQSDTSRSHDFRFVGGDFNQADTKLPTVFTDILNELNYSLPCTYPTFRLPNGYSSHLDLFLLQGPNNSISSSPPKFVTFWPTFHPTGHAVHICKFSRVPPVSPSPDDLVTSQIPSQIFYTPPSHNTIPTESSIIRQLPVLERSLLSLSCPTTPTVKAAIWAWWHSTRHSQTVSTSSHHINILYRKLSRAKGRLTHLPGPSWTWLLTHFPDTPTEGYHIIRDTHYLVSVPLLSDLLVKYSLLHPSQPPGPTRTQFTIPPAATWTKCGVAAPKIWAHQGAIKSSDGTICTTTASLDAALRATRSFWQDFPTPFHPAWATLLNDYTQQITPLPSCLPPGYTEFYHSIITSPDSAPGADGIPFSAWRLSPSVSSRALDHHFTSILHMQTPPPLQSLVFIPKADKGDYADNYRPLGLPNTCDRLIDRAAYSQFAPTLVGYLHPAQALLNTFREPQANFLTVQQFLDQTAVPGSVLLSDLAKAFERVNPHWIMYVLFALGTPYWVIIYCRHILFGRKVLHKIGSHTRPPLSLRTGVDMGRAFSVLLFCIAMDPWYHHVHKIPRVFINTGYMDDNATGGHGLSWLPETQKLIHQFHSAGFQVLTHSCYRVNPLFACPPVLASLEDCPPVIEGYPSLWQAYAALPPCPYVQLCCGSQSLSVPSSWVRITDVLSLPAHPHLLTRLHLCPCQCKCKTFLLPNFPLTAQDLLFLDSTPFGCKIAAASATMLGLFLHSPFTSILPEPSPNPAPPPLFNRGDLEQHQLNKAFSSMERRIRAASPLHLSFRDRTLYLSFYVLSLPHYHHSTLLPTPSLLNRYTSLIRKFLCNRHWIQAQHLPGIVSYLKLGILHCPKIFLYSSLLGFAIRRFGEPLVAWLCGIAHSLPTLPSQIETGLHSIRSLLSEALPYHSEPYSALLQAHLFQQISPYKLSHIVTKHFKDFLRRKLNFEARAFLLQRFSNVKWHFVASPQLFDMLHITPLKVVPAASRLAILRWAIDSDPDSHFRLRPHLTRHAPCRCGCGRLTSLYPEGLPRGPVCSSHLNPNLTWTLFLPQHLPVPFSHLISPPLHLPLPVQVHFHSRKNTIHPTLDFLPNQLQQWASQPCVLCGCGDNSVQHWLYFCPVPALAGSLLLRTVWKTSLWFLQETLSASRLSQIAGLWVSTRQFIHERSGLPPPSLDLPPVTSDTIPQRIPSGPPSSHSHTGSLPPCSSAHPHSRPLLLILLFRTLYLTSSHL